MKIVIITDGNSEQGLGHIYQSITLAGYLKERAEFKPEISFITKSGKNVVNLIKAVGFDVCVTCSDEEIFETLTHENPDRIIIDFVQVSPLLARRIKKELKIRLIIFTNLTSANEYADMTVMGTMGSGFKNIVKRRNSHIEFWGPKFLIIRKSFFLWEMRRKKPSLKTKKIMIMFGGADPANLTNLVLKELLSYSIAYEIKVVLGSAFSYRKELFELISENKNAISKVEVVENLTNVAECMHKADLVMVSPGISFFEALTVGTPVLCFNQNQFQRDAWSSFITTYDAHQVSELKILFEKRNYIQASDPFIVSMEIGRGRDEIIDHILN